MKIHKLIPFTVVYVSLLTTVALAQNHSGHELEANSGQEASHSMPSIKEKETATGVFWTCSMHPQIKLPTPGKCPICSMDLIPVETNESDSGDKGIASLSLNERAKKLAELEESIVERKWVSRDVRLVGMLDYDETKLKHITAWVPGRVQRMFIDYTGIEVNENDHMVSLYSPELISAQEELIQAARSLSRVSKGSSNLVKNSTRRTLFAAREKLKLLGLTEIQVKEIEGRGQAEDSVVIYAPMQGTVVEKHINEGMYVKEGSRIYTVADLSHLWLKLDAYESDLPWVAYGQEVEFRAEALPGERFSGIVSFVQPFLNETSRTVKVRVNVENQSKKLKPGMFVTATIKAQIDSSSNIISPSFFGKHICPMHPEVVSDTSGECPICGMDLVGAENIPFIRGVTKREAQAPVVIPASAPLITGKRAVVYVKDVVTGAYSPREVELGVRAGKYYVIQSGLDTGEVVVTKGAFKLDADLQIRGAKSMMNPSASAVQAGHSGH